MLISIIVTITVVGIIIGQRYEKRGKVRHRRCEGRKGRRETGDDNQTANGGYAFLACLVVSLAVFSDGLISDAHCPSRRFTSADANCLMCELLFFLFSISDNKGLGVEI